ncbi:hypothetical protein BJX62DRAFT_200173 [Aspergillus germanicus]
MHCIALHCIFGVWIVCCEEFYKVLGMAWLIRYGEATATATGLRPGWNWTSMAWHGRMYSIWNRMDRRSIDMVWELYKSNSQDNGAFIDSEDAPL